MPPRFRILVVDDFPDAVGILSHVLSRLGHEVRGATSGHAALEVAAEFEPDIGLFDVGLPDLSGHDVARTLRLRRNGARPYLIAITGWDDPARLAAALVAGFDHTVVKPIGAHGLAALIDQAAAVLAGRDVAQD